MLQMKLNVDGTFTDQVIAVLVKCLKSEHRVLKKVNYYYYFG